MIRTAVAMLTLFALALAGCQGAEADTPEKAFELLLTHVRNGEYEKVWKMYTPSLRERNLQDYREAKARWMKMIEDEDVNLDEYDNILKPQTGVGIRELVLLSEYDIVMRTLEVQRHVILKFRIVAPPKVRGDIARVSVSAGEDLPSSTWRFIRRGERWFLDHIPSGVGGMK